MGIQKAIAEVINFRNLTLTQAKADRKSVV